MQAARYIDTKSSEFELETLVRKYKANPPKRFRAKAVAEKEIRALFSEKDKKRVAKDGYAGKVLHDLLGGKASDYYFRETLLGRDEAGFDVDVVWKGLDEGLSHGALKVVLHEAMKVSGSKGGNKPKASSTFAQCLQEEVHKLRTIKGYMSSIKGNRARTGPTTSTPKKVVRTPPESEVKVPAAQAKTKPEPPQKTEKAQKKAPPKKEEPSPKKEAKGHVPKPRLHDQVLELIHDAPDVSEIEIPEGVDEDFYRASYTELLAYLRTVVYQSTRNFGRAKKRYIPRSNIISNQGISRRRVLSACDTLNMKAPKDGQVVDIKEAKRAWLLAARQSHPDLNNGSHASVELFQAAKTAYDCLVEYNENLGE